jgi:hypothetical protein
LLTAIPGLLLNMGEFLVTGFWNGIVFIWRNVVGWFHALPGMIIGFFASAGSWLFNAGKAILNGLWNGLKSIWNSVMGWIGGIGNWITSHKGPITADAVLLYPHGQAIMQGLHNGLKAGIPPILATLTNLSAQMGSTLGGAHVGSLALAGSASGARMMPPSIGAASAGGGSGGQLPPITVSLAVNVPPGTPAQVANQVGTLTQQAVNQGIYKAIRQMRGGARNYGFMPS